MNETNTGWAGFDTASITTTICNNNSFWINGNNFTISSNGSFLYSKASYEAKKSLVDKIIEEGQIELSSLTEDESIEIFELDEISYKGGKTRINCHKEIDLDYVCKLVSKSELLIEMVPLIEFAKAQNVHACWSSNSTGNVTWDYQQECSDSTMANTTVYNYQIQEPVLFV